MHAIRILKLLILAAQYDGADNLLAINILDDGS